MPAFGRSRGAVVLCLSAIFTYFRVNSYFLVCILRKSSLCSCIIQLFFVTLQRKSITMRQADIISQVKELGSRVIPSGSHLLLYGSRARGDSRADSDWDMLVLLNRPQNEDEDFRQISYPLMELGFDLGQYFSIHTYSQQEWQNMNFLPFYKNVEQDKIVLV